ncbi:MAG: hypothetical protein K1X71_11775 [Pirellulales bacterium]|nr:hypothetical protein [Pirellulales bacterium]
MQRARTHLPGSIASGAMVALATMASSHAVWAAPFDPNLLVPTPVTRHCAFAKDHSVPYKRGVAILSPVESPDRCPAYVGGKTIYTRYYPDYLPYRKHGDRVIIPGNGYGYHGPRGKVSVTSDVASSEVDAIESSDYGFFSGARQDEESLLRLGGSGAQPEGSPGSAAPQADLIDMLEHGGDFPCDNN